MMRARTEVSPRLSIIKRDDMLSRFGEVFIFNGEDGGHGVNSKFGNFLSRKFPNFLMQFSLCKNTNAWNNNCSISYDIVSYAAHFQ